MIRELMDYKLMKVMILLSLKIEMKLRLTQVRMKKFQKSLKSLKEMHNLRGCKIKKT